MIFGVQTIERILTSDNSVDFESLGAAVMASTPGTLEVVLSPLFYGWLQNLASSYTLDRWHIELCLSCNLPTKSKFSLQHRMHIIRTRAVWRAQNEEFYEGNFFIASFRNF